MSVSVAKSVKFYDGKTSKAHIVDVVLSGYILHITNVRGEELAAWSLPTLKIIEPPSPPVAGIISSDKYPDARLNIEAGKGWNYIKSRIPKNKRSNRLPTHLGAFISYSVLAIISLAFLFFMFPRIIGNLAYLMPEPWENTLGNQVMESMVGNDKICVARAGKDAIDRLTQKIQSKMQRKISYDIRVIDNSYVTNAFAAPGGHIIIYRSIIEEAGSPEEVAGVLAHEMAHVEQYHTTKALIRNMGLGFTLSMIFGDVGTLESVAQLLSQMSYSREDESAADMRAKEILNAINIDPRGLQDFLIRMSEQEIDLDFKGSEYLKYLSSHPDTKERIKSLSRDGKRKYNAAMSYDDWEDLLSICDESKVSNYE